MYTSKLLIHSADIVQTIKKAGTFGIHVESFSIDFQKIMEWVNKITDDNSNKIKSGLLQSENPVLYTEECYFFLTDKITFKTREKEDKEKNKENVSNKNSKYDINETITADKILIATGTVTKIPKIKGLVESGFITSDEALRLKKQPQTITFIGGGYIACELAYFLTA